MHKPLTVYRASAGAGKTFTLAVDYISLLVLTPDDYRHILAVTFTNKATQEMKTRILSQLYGIAHRLPGSDGYLRQVIARTGLAEPTVRSNARSALTLLVHKYSEFRILTIDAFFQQVLRNLAHELNLTANLHVDLNDRQTESNAVDELVDSLEPGQEVLTWIRAYIDRSIDDDLGWNVIGKLKDFGLNIFRDIYRQHRRELARHFADPAFLPRYSHQLRHLRDTARKQLNQAAADFISTLRDAGVDDPRYFRAHLYSWISAQATGTPTPDPPKSYVAICCEDPTKWTAAKCPRAEKTIIETLARESLQARLRQLDDLRLRTWHTYQSAVLTLAHLSQLRLLETIGQTVDAMNRNANRFLLVNTQALLRELMHGSDTPFIYEKIGARLTHVMIDEFQDTSTLQWQNFRVLLDNCLAQAGARCLIVGDVKQSIYRWRQGDWQLLSNIARDFTPDRLRIQTLTHNYRSAQRIVRFNNAFFREATASAAAELQADGNPRHAQLAEVYADAVQTPYKVGQQGYVRVDLLPNQDYRATVLDHLVSTVGTLLDSGYRQQDIAILVRSKTVIPDIANAFATRMKGRVRLVSDEAFRLDASLAVGVLIDALHLLVHPDDNCVRGRLVLNYQQQVLHTPLTESELLVAPLPDLPDDCPPDERRIRRDRVQQHHLNTYLPPEYVGHGEQLLQMPVTDLVDRLFALFRLDRIEGQSAYVCAFHDLLADYLRDQPSDIDDFTRQWADTLSSTTIQSDEIEGIRLITIHKSKGLEYDTVLLPFCDWELDKPTTIWCETQGKEPPFSTLPVLPIDYNRTTLRHTVYEPDYQEEHFHNVVDNMNLLYVAFTRAARNLIITGRRMSATTLRKRQPNETTTNRSQLLELVLGNVSQQLPGSTLTNADDPGQPLSFEYGSLAPAPDAHTDTATDGNPFTAPIATLPIHLQTFANAACFRQSNRSRAFVRGEDDGTPDRRAIYIKVGNVLHQLFATIRTEADIRPRLRELEQAGILGGDGLSVAELTDRIREAFRSEEVRDWFSSRWQLFNECTVLEYDASTDTTIEHRPDRVMTDGRQTIVVDFKFGSPREEYRHQVARYVSLLRRMGHPHVTGCLWYVMQNTVVPVDA